MHSCSYLKSQHVQNKSAPWNMPSIILQEIFEYCICFLTIAKKGLYHTYSHNMAYNSVRKYFHIMPQDNIQLMYTHLKLLSKDWIKNKRVNSKSTEQPFALIFWKLSDCSASRASIKSFNNWQLKSVGFNLLKAPSFMCWFSNSVDKNLQNHKTFVNVKLS